MSDEDKKFVEQCEAITDTTAIGQTVRAHTERLCRIIRELEAENLRLCNVISDKNQEKLDNAQLRETIYKNHEEIENAPWVYSGPRKGLGGVTEEWSLAEFEGEDTHRAKLLRIEKIDAK